MYKLAAGFIPFFFFLFCSLSEFHSDPVRLNVTASLDTSTRLVLVNYGNHCGYYKQVIAQSSYIQAIHIYTYVHKV